MIPITEELFKNLISSQLNNLKSNPDIINEIFRFVNPTFVNKIKQYIEGNVIKVIIGYPSREKAVLPCFCIMLGQETEENVYMGEFIEEDEEIIEEDEEDSEDDEIIEKDGGDGGEIIEKRFIETYGTVMNFSYRIECWADVGDLTVYLYHILKYIFIKCKLDLMKNGLRRIQLTGGDLEPMIDMYPAFVYRRALIVSGQVENGFVEKLKVIENLKVESTFS